MTFLPTRFPSVKLTFNNVTKEVLMNDYIGDGRSIDKVARVLFVIPDAICLVFKDTKSNQEMDHHCIFKDVPVCDISIDVFQCHVEDLERRTFKTSVTSEVMICEKSNSVDDETFYVEELIHWGNSVIYLVLHKQVRYALKIVEDNLELTNDVFPGTLPPSYHIAILYNVFFYRCKGQLYRFYLMEYCNCGTLESTQFNFSTLFAMDCVFQILEGLQVLWTSGFIHRGVALENIGLLDVEEKDGTIVRATVKLINFRYCVSVLEETCGNNQVPGYECPDRNEVASYKSDIYALGLVLLVLLGENDLEGAMSTKMEHDSYLKQLFENHPLRELLLGMLYYDSKDRHTVQILQNLLTIGPRKELSSDVLPIILNYLPMKDQVSSRLISRQFTSIFYRIHYCEAFRSPEVKLFFQFLKFDLYLQVGCLKLFARDMEISADMMLQLGALDRLKVLELDVFSNANTLYKNNFVKFEKLEELTCMQSYLDAIDMNSLKNLKKLHITGTLGSDKNALIRQLIPLGKLEQFNVKFEMDPSLFPDLFAMKSLTSLTYLSSVGVKDTELRFRCPQLKKLRIGGCSNRCFTLSLEAGNFPNLEHFEIIQGFGYQNRHTFQNLDQVCPKLTHFEICPHIYTTTDHIGEYDINPSFKNVTILKFSVGTIIANALITVITENIPKLKHLEGIIQISSNQRTIGRVDIPLRCEINVIVIHGAKIKNFNSKKYDKKPGSVYNSEQLILRPYSM